MEYILKCNHPVDILTDDRTKAVLGLKMEKAQHHFEAEDDASAGKWVAQHLEERFFLILERSGDFFHPEPSELLQDSRVVKRW